MTFRSLHAITNVNVQDLTVSTAFLLLGLKIAHEICGFYVALSSLIMFPDGKRFMLFDIALRKITARMSA